MGGKTRRGKTMKKCNSFKIKPILLVMVLVFTMVIDPTKAMAAEMKVNLGTTESFAILAGTGITNTGTTTISGDVGGDVGSHPTGTFTGQSSAIIGGAVHLADAVALAAKNDLVIAYDDAAGRTGTTIPVELGEKTMLPGVYKAGTFEISGTLTLDAQGDPESVFIFQAASTLVTGAGSKVVLKNGAKFCRIFWQVGSSATLGTNSKFIGHILALTSITASNGAIIEGQLLARNGTVTLENNTIMNGPCGAISALEGTPVVETITGGELPKTSTNAFEFILLGSGLLLIGGVFLIKRKFYE